MLKNFKVSLSPLGLRLLLIVCLGVLLAACGRAASPSAVEAGAPTAVELAQEGDGATQTITPAPTATATPTPLPPLAIVLAAAGSEAELVAKLEMGLAPAMSEAGLRLEVRPALTAADLSPNVRLVIVVPPDPGLAGLLSGAPDTQFLAVGLPGLQPAEQVSLVGPQGFRPDQAGFIAGVAAALITPDWRVGVLAPGDAPSSRAARQGFLNGAVYFCGLCLPYHGPSVRYPVSQELPAAAGEPEIQAAVQALSSLAVKTVYLPPGAGDDALAEALSGAGMILIGSGPMPQGLSAHWAASGQPDPLPAVLDLIPLLLSGQGGQIREMPFAIRDVNPALFGEGKQVYLQEIMADLLAGYIDTAVDPLTGETR
jgi:hypothetical protein